MSLSNTLFIMDVDGTLTSGKIIYSSQDEYKTFDVKDGLIIKSLSKLGAKIVLLTGRKSEAVEKRANELNAIAIQGINDKLTELKKILSKKGINECNTVYIGDDLNDYEAMIICGYKASPFNAVNEIKLICDYVSPYDGGSGAVRDICERYLREINKYSDFLDLFHIK